MSCLLTEFVSGWECHRAKLPPPGGQVAMSAKGLSIKQAEKTDFYSCQKKFETHCRWSRKLSLPLTSAMMGE